MMTQQRKPIPPPLTAKTILSSSGRYPDREKNATPAQRENAYELARAIWHICVEIDYVTPLDCTSGLRTPSTNATLPNAAKASLHLKGLAADFAGQDLAKAIRKHPEGANALRRNRLFMEAPESTTSANGGWTHLDRGVRTDRPNREFKP